MENCYLEKCYKMCHALGSMDAVCLNVLEQNKVLPVVVLSFLGAVQLKGWPGTHLSLWTSSILTIMAMAVVIKICCVGIAIHSPWNAIHLHFHLILIKTLWGCSGKCHKDEDTKDHRESGKRLSQDLTVRWQCGDSFPLEEAWEQGRNTSSWFSFLWQWLVRPDEKFSL